MSTQVETLIEVQLTNRNRATVFWRGILVAPFFIFLGSFQALAHAGWSAPIVAVPAFLALIFRGVYPFQSCGH